MSDNEFEAMENKDKIEPQHMYNHAQKFFFFMSHVP